MSLIKKDVKEIPEAGNANYRALADLNLDALITVDESAVIITANDAAGSLLGYSPDKMVNTSLLNYFSANAAAEATFQELTKKQKVVNKALTLTNEKNISFNGVATSGPHGSTEFVIILRDTAAAEKGDEYTHLASIIAYSNDAIISTDLEGTVQAWNKSAEKIFGFTAEEIVGRSISTLIPDTDLSRESDLLNKIKRGESVDSYEASRKRKDGKLIDVMISVAPVKDKAGNVIAVSNVAREITDQKQFERELIEAKKTAERDKKLAEEAVEAKQQFLSNMSHEIRTPLNAIIGFTKVVLKTNLDEKQREYLEAIKVSGDALIVLINDILDLAKVEAGKMSFEQIPFRMHDSITSMLHLFETKLIQKKIELIQEYDEQIPAVLVGDPVRLHQIILNLVSNAIKFTAKGKISVNVRLQQEDAEKAVVEFSVSDTGIGIPEDKLDTIFNNFQQASTTTARIYGGTGLGLAIVKQLVLSQGGSLQVKSKVDEGSVFTFTLPFKKTKEKVEIKKENEPVIEESSGEVKILVAEDVVLNQLLIKTLLKEFGFKAKMASNGKEAVELLKKERFSLVLMDLQMPEMNGYEATEYIRNTLKSDIPVIALTADVTTADVDKCRNMGMNDYVSKPIDDKLLYNKILKYVEGPLPAKTNNVETQHAEPVSERVTNLDYLRQHTKGNPEMMKQMIKIYLDETPKLIDTMKQSIDNMDWDSLKRAAHSIIPTFAIMGINQEYEEMAKKIKEHAAKREEAPLINTLLIKIDEICAQALTELESELDALS